jgi:uncharacterized membrane protein (DUF485 family)
MASHRAATPQPAPVFRIPPPRTPTDGPPDALGGADPRGGDPDFAAVHADPRFRDVRRRLRRFVLVTTVAFLVWYQVFVLLSAFAPRLMATPVVGAVNVGMLLGLSQFATTLAVVAAYRHYARTRIDPRVRALRERYAPAAPAPRPEPQEV